MLAHRLRRWPNIETTMGERLVLAGVQHATDHCDRSDMINASD